MIRSRGRGGSQLSRSPAQDLYRSVVLEHYRNPLNREPLVDPDASAEVDNPVCGDRVHVEVALDGRRIRAISARARGCSIAVAAASLMTELVSGLEAPQAAEIERGLAALVRGEPPPVPLDERLQAFAPLADLPSRRRCALLAWEALQAALES
jgi:nitrogen fixation NifU-like protein